MHAYKVRADACVCATADTAEMRGLCNMHKFCCVAYINDVNLESNLHTLLLLLSPRPPSSSFLPLMLFSPFHPLSECSDENPCEGLSRHATFDNFGMAFLTLFRVSTGDNWNGIMKVIFLSLLCSV